MLFKSFSFCQSSFEISVIVVNWPINWYWLEIKILEILEHIDVTIMHIGKL